MQAFQGSFPVLADFPHRRLYTMAAELCSRYKLSTKDNEATTPRKSDEGLVLKLFQRSEVKHFYRRFFRNFIDVQKSNIDLIRV